MILLDLLLFTIGVSFNRDKFDSHYHNFSRLSMSWLFIAMLQLYLIFFLEIENFMKFCLTVDYLKFWFQLPAICWNHFATLKSSFIISCVASQVLAHHWPWTITKRWKMKIFHANTAVQYSKNRTCIANTWRTILTVIIQPDYFIYLFFFLSFFLPFQLVVPQFFLMILCLLPFNIYLLVQVFSKELTWQVKEYCTSTNTFFLLFGLHLFTETKKEAGARDQREFRCRFCDLPFDKAQALGGHMNRHHDGEWTRGPNLCRQYVYVFC